MWPTMPEMCRHYPLLAIPTKPPAQRIPILTKSCPWTAMRLPVAILPGLNAETENVIPLSESRICCSTRGADLQNMFAHVQSTATFPNSWVASHCFQRRMCCWLSCRSDTKEKPYIYPCGRSFSRKDLLTRHEQLSHALDGTQRDCRGAYRVLTTDTQTCWIRCHDSHCVPGTGTNSHTGDAARDGSSVVPQSGDHHHELPQSSSLQSSDSSVLANTSISYTPDPFLLSSTDGLFADCDDPIYGFTRFLSHGDWSTDWDRVLVHPVHDFHNPSTSNHGIAQQITPTSELRWSPLCALVCVMTPHPSHYITPGSHPLLSRRGNLGII
jgi:hypothetical protein